MNWQLRLATPEQQRACETILRSLPAWFGIEEAIQHYVEKIQELPTYVALDGERVCGFVTIYQHNPYTAEVYVMAVDPTYHRRGIGRALIAQAEDWSRAANIEYLQVKTLGASHPSVEYAQTREFYLACGFRPLEEFDNLWPGNPCLILIKRL